MLLLLFNLIGLLLVSEYQCAKILKSVENDTPIIGILAQETSYALEQVFPDSYKSFIAASYVKFVEGGGARVVPIWIDRERKYYEDIMGNINGVLFPGGATWFNQSQGYADDGRHIYDIAVEMNDRGEHFPLWGTCLGFELLTFLAAGGVEHRIHCRSNKQPLHLDFKPDFRESQMFGDAPDNVINILSNEPVTANFHQYCVTEQNLTDFNLAQDWRVMSLNDDWDGLTFISTIESKRYPFFGVQFHPEKNIYEWMPNRNISHTRNALTAAQFFAERFVAEARKSSNHFEDPAHEQAELIYNYPTTYTGLEGVAYEECYMFDFKTGTRNNEHIPLKKKRTQYTHDVNVQVISV